MLDHQSFELARMILGQEARFVVFRIGIIRLHDRQFSHMS